MNNTKIWLCLMAGSGCSEDLKELIDPILSYFDGIVAVYHNPKDEGSEYLEQNKKAGKIIYLDYCRRHDFSRNHYLWCGPIQNGDWVVTLDCLERIPICFASKIKEYIAQFQQQGINLVYFHGKPYLFEYNESMTYIGSPHEGLVRQDGRSQMIELNKYFTEQDCRINMRPIKRSKFHFIDGYAKYHLFPYGSNNSALGLEKRLNGKSYKDAYLERESDRLEFLAEIDKRGFDRSIDGLKKMLSVSPLDERLRNLINKDIVWINFYRYHILGDTNIVDNHDHNNRQLLT